MKLTYTVALQGCSDVPTRVRIDAEVRFARELERVLGSEDAVGQVYRAWVSANELDASQLDSIMAVKATRWPRAFIAATQAGFSRIGDIGEGHFEVRLAPAFT